MGYSSAFEGASIPCDCQSRVVAVQEDRSRSPYPLETAPEQDVVRDHQRARHRELPDPAPRRYPTRYPPRAPPLQRRAHPYLPNRCRSGVKTARRRPGQFSGGEPRKHSSTVIFLVDRRFQRPADHPSTRGDGGAQWWRAARWQGRVYGKGRACSGERLGRGTVATRECRHARDRLSWCTYCAWRPTHGPPLRMLVRAQGVARA